MSDFTQSKKFLPKTDAEFQEYLTGDKQPRPKILIHPDTNEYWRLVEQRGVPLSKWPYEQIQRNTDTINFYAIGEEKLKEAAGKEVPIPQGCHIRSFRLHPEKLHEGEEKISPVQAFHLINAIGIDSSWWPLEDPSYNFEEVFGNARFNILFRGEKPVGTIIWDDSKIAKDGSATWIMVGVMPEERQNRYGSFLINWQMHELATQGATTLEFYTGDNDVITNKNGTTTPAIEYYKRLGATNTATTSLHHPFRIEKEPFILPIDHAMLDMDPKYFLNAGGGGCQGFKPMN